MISRSDAGPGADAGPFLTDPASLAGKMTFYQEKEPSSFRSAALATSLLVCRLKTIHGLKSETSSRRANLDVHMDITTRSM